MSTPSDVEIPAVSGSPQALIDTVQLTTGAGQVQRQVVTLGDPTTAANLAAIDSSGALLTKSGPSPAALLTAEAISFSGSGQNSVIAGTGGSIIRVYRMVFTVDDLTQVKLQDGSNDLTGLLGPFGPGGGPTLDYSGEPWFTCSTGNAFNIFTSNSVQVGGVVYYVKS